MERYAVSWPDVDVPGAELVRQHDDERPYAPENGHPLAFAPGDRVTFVNDYGVRFPGHVVVRIMQRDEDEWLYCAGRRYFIDSDSPWFPVCEENLLPE